MKVICGLILFHASTVRGGVYSVGGKDRGKKWKLAQIVRKCNEDRINDKTKLTPLLLMPAQDHTPQKYCTLVILAFLVCDMFGFYARRFPAKSERKMGHFFLNAPGIKMSTTAITL